MKKKTWRDFEIIGPRGNRRTITKKEWRAKSKDFYLVKGGPDKGKPSGSSKIFSGKYYERENFMVRNDKVDQRKKELKSLGYSVRTKKKGKFSTIYFRPNFEAKKTGKKTMKSKKTQKGTMRARKKRY